MLDTAEQTAVLPESPVQEFPPQLPESETPQPENPAQDEAVLTAEITELWRMHSDYKGTIKNQTENLRSLRSELGKRLAEMKGLHARPGRNGQWSAWLKERKTSRATADRLVNKHERSLHPELNRPNESITEPTEAEIQSLLDKVAPKLRRELRTPASVYTFLDLLSASFKGVERRVIGEGIVISALLTRWHRACILSDHPKPATEYHLKTGQRE